MKTQLYIGTSGWHYNHWIGKFYPPDIKGYNELKFHSLHFSTVENNSSFYRISKDTTYKTWMRMVPGNYKFSIKLNKFVTHVNKLELNEDVEQTAKYIISSTQVLENKMGAMVIQLPASFKYDIEKLEKFLEFFVNQVRSQGYKFDIAIEFRNKYWFNEEVYTLLRKYNVALVFGQSSRYPGERKVTADFAYIRMHGPEKLFSSSYSTEQLEELANYIESISGDVKRVYVYFNNDFEGYALGNAKELMQILNVSISA